jgi:hypothetical protein
MKLINQSFVQAKGFTSKRKRRYIPVHTYLVKMYVNRGLYTVLMHIINWFLFIILKLFLNYVSFKIIFFSF